MCTCLTVAVPYFTVDASVNYLFNALAWKQLPGNKHLGEPQFLPAHLIKHLVPQAKILVILRDPVKRYWWYILYCIQIISIILINIFN